MNEAQITSQVSDGQLPRDPRIILMTVSPLRLPRFLSDEDWISPYSIYITIPE